MSGLKIVLPTSFTDPTLPLLINDPILASGSLALYDATFDSTGGVGAHVIDNLAYDQAKALITAGTPTTLGLPLTKFGSPSASSIKIERTPKGGIHVMSSKTVVPSQGEGWSIELGTAIKDYIVNHLDNTYYMSAWWLTTRTTGFSNIENIFQVLKSPGGAGNTVLTPVASGPDQDNQLGIIYAPSTTNYSWYAGASSGTPIKGVASYASSFLSPTTASAAPTLHRASASRVKWFTSANTPTKSVPSSAADVIAGFMGGRIGNAQGDAGKSSNVFYRFYFEDLTVSGRSYATVDAIDAASYAAAFATGGRFYGDTFSNPATALP